jgi:hypothetical protein
MELDEAQERFERAYCSFRDAEGALFGEGATEPTLAALLRGYLAPEFGDHSVDAEYARHLGKPKYLARYRQLLRQAGLEVAEEDRPRRIDLVIHERGTDERNLLAIEIKRSVNRRDRRYDRLKLQALREELGYEFTLFLELGPDGEVLEADWRLR